MRRRFRRWLANFLLADELQRVVAVSTQLKAPWTIQIRLLSRQDDLEVLVSDANTYCRDCRAHSARFRPIRHIGLDVSEAMMSRQAAFRLPKMAAIQIEVPLNPQFVVLNPTTVQFHLFRADTLETIEGMANGWCLQHQARKADIQFDSDTDQWVIIITHEV